MPSSKVSFHLFTLTACFKLNTCKKMVFKQEYFLPGLQFLIGNTSRIGNCIYPKENVKFIFLSSIIHIYR